MLSSADPEPAPRPALPRVLTDEELLQAIRVGAPEFSVRKSGDDSIWIAVETPFPPQHRIYACYSLLDLTRNLLGLDAL